ncbi:ParM/StbA family protein [Lactococcus sp. S64]|uniref:ParM/StbA family protein n=1 Tax=Lactococcus sp. S64 TaxID=2767459 RepID=UPI001902E915|nr:ParM/StbA family protein [Lactococcus sp. S64]MBK0084379.1 ParM/StbA family protein [Lactococcus sp. S64]
MGINIKKTLIALDLGNNQVKVKSKKTGLIVMPSALLENKYGPTLYLGGEPDNIPSLYRLRLDKEEKAYYFGETLASWGKSNVNHWERSIGFKLKRYQGKTFQMIALFSIARVVKELEIRNPILDLVTGLPSKDFQDETKEILPTLRKLFKGRHTIYVDDVPISFEIAEVKFYPQYIGTVVDNSYRWTDHHLTELRENFSEFMNIRYGIMDIGGGTILSDIVDGLNFNLSTAKPDSKNGAHRLFNHIIKEYSVSSSQVDLMLRNPNEDGKYIINQKGMSPIDLTDKVLEAKALYTTKVAKEMEKTFFEEDLSAESDGINLDKIFLTGGGTYIIDFEQLKNELQNSYVVPDQFTEQQNFIEILKHPETSNVEGYFKLGAVSHLGEFIN